MSRYAPVLPVEIAAAFKDQEALGTYHLLLAHDVVQKQEEYQKVYGGITDNDITHDVFNDPGIIIMDNSVIELGAPVGPGTMKAAVEAVNANVIVLPDFLLDREKTVEAIWRGADAYGDILANGKCEALAIPQGDSFPEWIRCLENIVTMDSHNMISWIGIPKNLNEKLGVSRKLAVDAIKAICPWKHCHMFGFSDDLWDDIMATRYGWEAGIVRGIDSAAPIWSGMRDGHVLTLAENIPGKRMDWWDNPYAQRIPKCPGTITERMRIQRAINNANKVREWLNPNMGV